MNTTTRTPIDYIIELRTRLLYAAAVTAGILIILLPFSNALYRLLAKPLLKQLPHASALIATNLTAPFFIPLKFSMMVAFVLAIPFLLYQLWAFVAPALYRRERRWIWPLIFGSSLLFYLGMLFAYFVVFPFIFSFFVQTVPLGVRIMPDISQYLSLATQFLIAFGLAFEVPVAIVILVITNIVPLQKIIQIRRYFILAAFVIAMFITPPDVVSQSLLAIPLCLLFEIGLLSARFFIRMKT